MSDFVWQDGQTVVMTGDSITDCGRRQDAGPYGRGYVCQVIDLVRGRYPERAVEFVNTGISGHCVDDLRDRWQADVLDHRPDWVTIMIGINDLHRTLNDVKHLPPDVYEDIYRGILAQVRDAGAKLVLIDPFYLSLDHGKDTPQGEVLKRLEGYLDVVGRLASEFDAIHVPTQTLWLKVLAQYPPGEWCPEPVHPNVHGHLAMAQMILGKLGY